MILFSIHSDECKSFECQHQTALRVRRSYALSWKPCQGDSLNLPDHRDHGISKMGLFLLAASGIEGFAGGEKGFGEEGE
ncbi:hypothetical protein Tco_1318780 [Tanacetum coccineum]